MCTTSTLEPFGKPREYAKGGVPRPLPVPGGRYGAKLGCKYRKSVLGGPVSSWKTCVELVSNMTAAVAFARSLDAAIFPRQTKPKAAQKPVDQSAR